MNEYRRAAKLAVPGSPVARGVTSRIQSLERDLALTRRLPAVLKSLEKPRDSEESLAFAQLCYNQGMHIAAARLWASALATDPKLGNDRQLQHRYNAACAAALAAGGMGKDVQPPDAAAKTGLRKQALEWLKAELGAWSRFLASGPPQPRPSITQTLEHWNVDPDLSSVRDPDALARLPESERNQWQRLWKSAHELLRQARSEEKPGSVLPVDELPTDVFAP
jgi:hypothetical protein